MGIRFLDAERHSMWFALWRATSAMIRPALLVAVFLVGGIEFPRSVSAAEQKVPFRSWTTLRAQGVVLQRLDFSCGAASIATLSTYYLGKPVSEEQVLRIIRARYSAEEWKKKKDEGMSAEDLVYMAEQLGLKAEGVRIGLAGLLQLKGPVIVHLDKGEFQHFTVLRGIRGLTVYLADPITGSVPMPMGTFLEQFTGTVLAVWDQANPLPSDFSLKLKERDTYHDSAYNVVRPHLLDRGPRGIRPVF